MNLRLNNKVTKYLKSLSFDSTTRLIVTNLDKTIFDTHLDINNQISKKLLKYLLTVYTGSINVKQGKHIIKIFDNDKLNNNYVSQLILPIKIKNKIHGSIIINNYNNIMGKEAIELLNTIVTNVEFYTTYKKENEYIKYENNPIYNNNYRKEIIDILDGHINKLAINNEFKYIEELIYIKIDKLKSGLNSHDKHLLNEIIRLFKEEKEFYGMFGMAIGVTYNSTIK